MYESAVCLSTRSYLYIDKVVEVIPNFKEVVVSAADTRAQAELNQALSTSEAGRAS